MSQLKTSTCGAAGLYFPRYAAYGWGVPSIIVTFCFAIDTSGFIPSFAIGYGEGGCWIGHQLASFLFNFLPMLYVSCTNIILYMLTVSSINYVSSITDSGGVHFIKLKDDTRVPVHYRYSCMYCVRVWPHHHDFFFILMIKPILY